MLLLQVLLDVIDFVQSDLTRVASVENVQVQHRHMIAQFDFRGKLSVTLFTDEHLFGDKGITILPFLLHHHHFPSLSLLLVFTKLHRHFMNFVQMGIVLLYNTCELAFLAEAHDEFDNVALSVHCFLLVFTTLK